MKRLLFRLSAIFFVTINVSCNPSSYFTTPNNVRNIPSTVYLKDGEVIEGKLHVESNIWGRQSVKVHKQHNDEVVMFDIEDLKGYKSNNSFYDLKEITTGVGKGYHHKFMKRLTPADSRIHLYEHVAKTNLPDKNKPNNGYIRDYYVQLPNEKGDIVWSLGSKKFHPHFNRKMAQVVKNCPEVSKKVADKEVGYNYHHNSFQPQNEPQILMNIINDYNNCK
jgi:hypothetical protein